MSLKTRLDRLEALLACQPRPERRDDLTEEEFDAMVASYITQRDLPGGYRDSELDGAIRSMGYGETVADYERARAKEKRYRDMPSRYAWETAS